MPKKNKHIRRFNIVGDVFRIKGYGQKVWVVAARFDTTDGIILILRELHLPSVKTKTCHIKWEIPEKKVWQESNTIGATIFKHVVPLFNVEEEAEKILIAMSL